MTDYCLACFQVHLISAYKLISKHGRKHHVDNKKNRRNDIISLIDISLVDEEDRDYLCAKVEPDSDYD